MPSRVAAALSVLQARLSGILIPALLALAMRSLFQWPQMVLDEMAGTLVTEMSKRLPLSSAVTEQDERKAVACASCSNDGVMNARVSGDVVNFILRVEKLGIFRLEK